MYDVVVIGGGPVGSRVACLMAEKGHRILVLEAKKTLGDKCCAGIIGQECADTFNINEKVILRTANSAGIFSPAGNRLHVYREEPQAVILDRAAFDVMMAQRAQCAGAEYRFDHRVAGVMVTPDRVEVSLHGDDPKPIAARCAVAACGFAPGLLRKLGLGPCQDFTCGVQAEVKTAGLTEVEVYLGNMAPGFFAWLVPVTPSAARAGLMVRKKPGHHLKRWLEHLESQGKIASADVKINFGLIPLRPLPRTYGERLIAVGDASGQVKPVTGGGIYYGLLCADIAAATLHRALAVDDLSAKNLTAYEKAWHRKLGKEIGNGYRARKLFERLSYGRIDSLFRLAKSWDIEEAISQTKGVSFDWHSRTLRRLLKYRGPAGFLKIIGLLLKTR